MRAAAAHRIPSLPAARSQGRRGWVDQGGLGASEGSFPPPTPDLCARVLPLPLYPGFCVDPRRQSTRGGAPQPRSEKQTWRLTAPPDGLPGVPRGSLGHLETSPGDSFLDKLRG